MIDNNIKLLPAYQKRDNTDLMIIEDIVEIKFIQDERESFIHLLIGMLCKGFQIPIEFIK